MGEHNLEETYDEQKLRAFMASLLDDLRALEQMVDSGAIESGVRRIGAEQEMFLVDRDMRPAPFAMDVLNNLGDPRITTGMARFNLEANVAPRVLEGNCLRHMEQANFLISPSKKLS